MKLIVNILSLSLMLIILSGCGAQQFKTDVFQNFYSTGWGPTAMTFNGRELIVGEDTLVMELTSIETGMYISEGYPYNGNGFFNYVRQPQSIRSVNKISGLAWENECCGLGYLWVADALNQQIVKISPSNESVKVISTAGFYPQGLAYDGKNLWTIDLKSGKIYNIDSVTGVVLKVFAPPISKPVALAYDCDNLIILGLDDCKGQSNCINKRLVKMNTTTGRLTEEIKIPRQMQRPVSIAVAKDKIWVGDKILNRVFKIDNSGDTITDDERSYLIAHSPLPEVKPKKIEIVDKPKVDDEAKKSADEAKDAAERAKKAADEAKDAAEKAKKAFELQQKK